MNYKKFYAVRKEVENRIRAIVPAIKNVSGIYMYTRTENGFKFCYCGQAKHLVDRLIAHSTGYDQHIDLSIKKRGLWSETNPTGWRISYKYFPENELDEREREYILRAHQNGFQLLNVEIGGTVGKTDIGERKATKGYRQGLQFGYLKAQREVANLFDKHLNYSQKSDKPNKNQAKAIEKFESFLNYKDENEVETND